ncbi:MAG TPA: phosphotransferase, partial [Lacipirellulaceae bacterium]|nr:phosphotransferase [Lacipirellulaceae bacterium]
AIDAAALAHRAAAHGMIPQAHERALAAEAVGLVALVAPQLRHVAERCAGTPLPLQWRLGDVWHDHVLFTGNRVTGLLDFGAAGIDSPAGDVARLLGSLAADDADAWALGLAAYEAVRKLSPDEWQAAEAFDATGSTLAAWNWLRWLWPGRGDAPGPVVDRPAALERLQRLLPRLRRLAAGIAGARGGVDHGPG